MVDDINVSDESEMSLTVGDLTILTEVDRIVAEAIEVGDPSIATRFGRSLKRNIRISGVALAKLLWEIESSWGIFQAKGIEDDFFSVMDTEMGVPPSTAHKYSRMWNVLFVESGINDEIKQRLLGKPIRELLLLPALVSEQEVDWNQIIDSDREELRDLIRGERGGATSTKNAIFIRIDLRTGQLSAKKGDGNYEPFGVLNMQARKNSPAIDGAIARILCEARIQEV